MALKDDHAQRARDNEDIARKRLDSHIQTDRPWIITALFYAALHWIEAYLAAKGYAGYVDNHRARMAMVRQESNLKRIHSEYRLLMDRSWEARYQLRAFMDAELDDVQRQYDRLRAFVEPLV